MIGHLVIGLLSLSPLGGLPADRVKEVILSMPSIAWIRDHRAVEARARSAVDALNKDLILIQGFAVKDQRAGMLAFLKDSHDWASSHPELLQDGPLTASYKLDPCKLDVFALAKGDSPVFERFYSETLERGGGESLKLVPRKMDIGAMSGIISPLMCQDFIYKYAIRLVNDGYYDLKERRSRRN